MNNNEQIFFEVKAMTDVYLSGIKFGEELSSNYEKASKEDRVLLERATDGNNSWLRVFAAGRNNGGMNDSAFLITDLMVTSINANVSIFVNGKSFTKKISGLPKGEVTIKLDPARSVLIMSCEGDLVEMYCQIFNSNQEGESEYREGLLYHISKRERDINSQAAVKILRDDFIDMFEAMEKFELDKLIDGTLEKESFFKMTLKNHAQGKIFVKRDEKGKVELDQDGRLQQDPKQYTLEVVGGGSKEIALIERPCIDMKLKEGNELSIVVRSNYLVDLCQAFKKVKNLFDTSDIIITFGKSEMCFYYGKSRYICPIGSEEVYCYENLRNFQTQWSANIDAEELRKKLGLFVDNMNDLAKAKDKIVETSEVMKIVSANKEIVLEDLDGSQSGLHVRLKTKYNLTNGFKDLNEIASQGVAIIKLEEANSKKMAEALLSIKKSKLNYTSVRLSISAMSEKVSQVKMINDSVCRDENGQPLFEEKVVTRAAIGVEDVISGFAYRQIVHLSIS